MRTSLALLLLSALPTLAGAQSADPNSAPAIGSTVAPVSDRRRFGLGVQFGIANAPGGHEGIPVAPYRSYSAHVSFAVTFRAALDRASAIDVGLGVPHVGLGLGLWASYERSHAFATDRRALARFELYAAPGLQLAFAGPDYAARHDNAWVGFGYIYQGRLAFGARLAMGARLVLVRRFDLYLEAVPMLDFTPSVETLFTLVGGTQVRF